MLTSWEYANASGTVADASAEHGKLISRYMPMAGTDQKFSCSTSEDEIPYGLHCQGGPPVVAAIGKFSCFEVAGQPLRDLYTARSAGTGSPISRDVKRWRHTLGRTRSAGMSDPATRLSWCPSSWRTPDKPMSLNTQAKGTRANPRLQPCVRYAA